VEHLKGDLLFLICNSYRKKRFYNIKENVFKKL
jgi:hypothetical protein